jgi:nickel-dependent lactate racemase
MKVHLQYGRCGLEVELPDDTVVIQPAFVPGLSDEALAVREALRDPIGAKPLADLVSAHERVAIVIPDLTRPLPSDRLLPWVLDELAHVPRERITIVNGTGSHRVNTTAELRAMVGAEVLERYRVVNHDAHDPSTHSLAGKARDGRNVRLNREYVEADRRIVLGFIEPHFMAGFSGGYKGVFPALGAIETIMAYHSAQVIADPMSTWGELEGNPTQSIVRDYGSILPVDFLVNVTLNRRRELTGVFAGDVLLAHARGVTFARCTAMVPCARRFPIVVTTNAGFPLDQNLYQTVKGMSAAAQIVEDGGLILTASECCDGFPEHGNFRRLLFEHESPQALLAAILSPGFSVYDQWEAQLLAMLAVKARLALKSSLPKEDVRRAHIEPVDDLGQRVAEEVARLGRDAPIAVLPEGPMTIPYVA